MPLDSPKFPTIDWPYLSVIRADGSYCENSTLGPCKRCLGSKQRSLVPPLRSSELESLAYDRVTLWYGNLAFDYIAASAMGLTAEAVSAGNRSANQRSELESCRITDSFERDGRWCKHSKSQLLCPVSTATCSRCMRSARMSVCGQRRAQPYSRVALRMQPGDVTLDFTALGIPQIRLMWLTFAPPLANASAFADVEWEAKFTNWTLRDPESTRTTAGSWARQRSRRGR